MIAKPLVSVVMSVYNGAAALEESLNSILGQAGVDFEFIVINDGSSDHTRSILDARAAVDSRLRVVHQQNTGLTRALIVACQLAEGTFIARQDCGDVSLPGRLLAQMKHLQSHPDDVVVGCDYELVGPKGELLRIHRGSEDGVADLVDRSGTKVPGPHHGSVMFRADAYRAVDGYRPEFYFAQDIDLWSRLLEVGDIGYVPEVLYCVTFEPGSITARHRPAQQRLRRLILQAAATRRAGESDEALRQQAVEIRPQRATAVETSKGPHAAVEASYFIASCLFERGDSRSRLYLRQVLQRQPLHWRAWSKWLASFLRGHRAPS